MAVLRISFFSLLLLVSASVFGSNLAKADKNVSINPWQRSTCEAANNIVDFSSLYEERITPKDTKDITDCTQDFIDGKLTLDSTFFLTYDDYGDQRFYFPVNGILGKDCSRIEVIFYPTLTKTDALTYSVSGRTKVRNNICDFTGEIKIKKSIILLMLLTNQYME